MSIQMIDTHTNQEANMSTVTNKFRATANEMGIWDGQEQEAADCWNKYVAPALMSLHERRADETGDDDGITGSIQSLAWDKFCDTDDEESWDELGRRVAAFVTQ